MAEKHTRARSLHIIEKSKFYLLQGHLVAGKKRIAEKVSNAMKRRRQRRRCINAPGEK